MTPAHLEERSKADKETNNERNQLFVTANPNQRPTQALVREWLKNLKATEREGKVTGLALTPGRVRYAVPEYPKTK